MTNQSQHPPFWRTSRIWQGETAFIVVELMPSQKTQIKRAYLILDSGTGHSRLSLEKPSGLKPTGAFAQICRKHIPQGLITGHLSNESGEWIQLKKGENQTLLFLDRSTGPTIHLVVNHLSMVRLSPLGTYTKTSALSQTIPEVFEHPHFLTFNETQNKNSAPQQSSDRKELIARLRRRARTFEKSFKKNQSKVPELSDMLVIEKKIELLNIFLIAFPNQYFETTQITQKMPINFVQINHELDINPGKTADNKSLQGRKISFDLRTEDNGIDQITHQESTHQESTHQESTHQESTHQEITSHQNSLRSKEIKAEALLEQSHIIQGETHQKLFFYNDEKQDQQPAKFSLRRNDESDSETPLNINLNTQILSINLLNEIICAFNHDHASGTRKLASALELDLRLSIGSNIDALFKELKRKKKTLEMGSVHLRKFRAEIDLLNQVIRNLQTGTGNENEITEIKKRFGLSELKQKSIHKPEEVEESAFREYLGHNNAIFRVSKNALDGDRLCKMSKSNDCWFHVNQSKGSHVFLVAKSLRGHTPDPTQLRQGCILALHFSGERGTLGGEVQISTRNFLRKPKGLPPGLWLVQRAETSHIHYENTEIRELLDSAKPC